MLRLRSRWKVWAILVTSAVVCGLLGGLVAAASEDTLVNSEDAAGSADGGRKLYLTIYNDNLALIRDIRTLPIQLGRSSLSFTDIPSRIDATSVSLRSLTEEGSIRILEQNYEYDMVSGNKLLTKYLGQHIEIVAADGTEYAGYLMSAPGSGDSLILAEQPWGGAITAIQRNEIRVIRYPQLPAGLVMKPTLVWEMENNSDVTQHEMEVAYLTGGLSWSADYVLTLNADDTIGDLTGWVTITNNSGVTFENAELKLVAGDVNQVSNQVLYYDTFMRTEKSAMAAAPAFGESSLFEYHLYKLAFPTTVKDSQTKQIQLLTAADIPVEKQYVFGRIPGSNRYWGYSDKVQVVLRLENSEENNMGMPLPEGRVRVNKADVDGSLEFIGEDTIDHTPKDEEITLYIGDAFDITGERINTKMTSVGSNSRQDSYRIELKNHKDEAIQVHVVESMASGTYRILSSSHTYEVVDAQTIEFVVDVPADGQTDITYDVLYTW